MRCTLDICAKGATDMPFGSIFAYRQSIFAQAREVFNAVVTYYPLIHRRRDGGPPSPQRLLRNRGKVGMGGKKTAERWSTFSTMPNDFRLYVKNCLEEKKQVF